MSQKKNSFDKETLVKIGKGALIAGGGALATYLLQAIAQLDLGSSSALITAVCAILINAIREFNKGK
jgi:hypothetical protein